MTTKPENPNTFSLANRSLKLDTAEDIKLHVAPLVNSTTITEIRLSGNTLGVAACEYLASVLREKSSLHTALLADIFTARLLSEIPPALSSLLTSLLPLHNLRTVDLSDNAFGLNTQAPLVAFLEQHVPLQHLILNNNGLGPNAGVLIADALTTLASRKEETRKNGARDIPQLTTIICGRNRLESGSMGAWSRTFRAHQDLQVVKMVQNGIRQEGISVLLCEGLKNCGALEVLDLQDNTFTTAGANSLADVLEGWTQIKELGVGDCLLGGKGALAIFAALQKGSNRKLRVLRAQYDEIDASGIKSLLQAITDGKLDSLRRIELNGNRFDEDDPSIEELRIVLEDRKRKIPHASSQSESSSRSQLQGGHNDDGNDDDDDAWGLDDLTDLEEVSSDEEDDADADEDEDLAGDDSAEETDLKAERALKEADKAEQEAVAQRKDPDVDALAEGLERTGI